MRLVALDSPAPLSQALVTGQLTDSVTQRGIELFDARLEYEPTGGGGTFRPFPARFRRSGGGYFAFHLDPAREMPAMTGALQPALRVTFAAAGRQEVSRTDQIAIAELALVTEEVVIDGKSTDIQRVAGAPFDFSETIAPSAVALAGYVFRDHDPDDPAAGAAVSIIAPPSVVTATTDAAGWFRLDSLPIAADVTVRVVDGPRAADFAIRPDFSTPVNETVLSVSTA